MLKFKIILICCLLISKILSQALLYDKSTSGPAIGFGILKSGGNTGFSGNIEYIISGHHVFDFTYVKVDDKDYHNPIKSYSFSYIGIMHETDRKPALHFQTAMNLGYTYMTDLTSNIVTGGLSLFKRFKTKGVIVAPAIYGAYSITFGGTVTSQNILQYGGSITFGTIVGAERGSVIAFTPGIAISKDTTVLSLEIGISINSICPSYRL